MDSVETIGNNTQINKNVELDYSGGLTIGNNSIVASGSVVTKDVPENVIVAENPAKITQEYLAFFKQQKT